MHLKDSDKKRLIYYHKREEVILKPDSKNLIKVLSDSFHYSKLKIKRVEDRIKIISRIIQKYMLSSIFRYEIPSLYPQWHQLIELHQDKASSHTSQFTVNLMKEMG